MNEALSDRLINMSVGRGWISPAAGGRARSLVRNGLSVEQALVGTGLVERDGYAEVLSEASGLDLAGPSTWNDEELFPVGLRRDAFALPLELKGKTAVVGFADPRAETIKRVRSHLLGHSLRLDPRVALRSDVRTALGPQEASVSIPRLARIISVLAHAGQASQVSLIASDGGEAVQFDEYPPSLLLSRGMASALCVRLPSALGSVWTGERRPTLFGRIAGWFRKHVTPHSTSHPLDLSGSVREALEHPHGLVVLVNGDRRVRHWLNGTEARIMDASTEASAEEAAHAALAGHDTVALASNGAPWWESLAGAVPLTVIRRHRQPEGSAWEIWHA